MSASSNKLPSEISTSDLARLLGITTARIGQLTGQGILTHTQRGLYDPAAAVQAYLAFKVRSAGAASGPGYAAARTRWMQERAALVKLERQEKQGLLVPAAPLEEIWSAVYGAARDRLLVVPNRVGAQWGMVRTTIEAAQLVRRYLEEAMNEVASMPVLIAGADEPTEGAETANADGI